MRIWENMCVRVHVRIKNIADLKAKLNTQTWDKVFRIWACYFDIVAASDCLSVGSFIRLSVSEVWDYLNRNYPDSKGS